MHHEPQPDHPHTRGKRKWARILVKTSAIVAILVLTPLFFLSGNQSSNESTTFAAVRGDLKISVLQGGTVRALESQEVKSHVKGWPKIISIVDEGYRVTAEDVANELVLVELERADLEERQIEETLSYQGKRGDLDRVVMDLEMQILERDRNMKEAELRRKFARLDFEKYMGVEASNEILEKLDLETLILSGQATGSYSVDLELPELDLPELDLPDEDSAEIEDEVPAASSGPSLTVTKAHIGVEPSPEESPTEVPDEPADLEVEMVMRQIPDVDFHEYASPEKLGDGEASQRLLDFDDRVSMAERKLKLDETKLEGTRRLFEKDFVNRNQLETEEMQVENSRLAAKSARTSRSLFLRYEFPKDAQQRLSDYEDALSRYVRRDIETRRHIVGIGTDLIWKRKSVDHRLEKLDEIADQLERTIVTAEREGLVVYGGVDKEQWGGDKIKEGASVRQWQTILTIPDMTTMIVLVKIHEADISSIELGQRADIVFDSEPDQPLTGVVDKVSVLANSQEAAMNPDLKVYDVTVRIDGTHEWVMPSMSAKTEIQVKALSEVVYIPILAIQARGAERFCYVDNGGSKPERRVVETGDFNDRFIVIASGLEEGERVLLNPPVDKTIESEEPDVEQDSENSDPGLVKIPGLSEDS